MTDQWRIARAMVLLPVVWVLGILVAEAKQTESPAPPEAEALPPVPESADELKTWCWDVALWVMNDDARVLTTADFRILTDHPSEGAERLVLQNLEVFRRFYVRVMSDVIELEPDIERVNVFYFTEADAMTRFAEALEVSTPEDVGGLHSGPLGFLAFDGSDTLFQEAVASLFHEATHLFNEQFTTGEEFAWWVDEGLAVYFAGTRVDKHGRFEVGAIRDSQRRHLTSKKGRQYDMTIRFDPREDLRLAFYAYARQEHLTLDKLLAVNNSKLNERNARLAYTESWLLVHYLLHAHEGSAAAEVCRVHRTNGRASRG